jgi:hypothetical protein
MFQNAKIRALVGAALLFGLSACHGQQGGGTPVAPGFYDFQGRLCGYSPYPGCTYLANGGKAMVWDDPYYGGMVQFSYSWGYCTGGYASGAYCSATWWSPTGVWYGRDGYAINATAERGRDLITDIAEDERAAIDETVARFADRYGLAEVPARELVTQLNAFERATRGRGRTPDDYETLSRRLLGRGYAEAVSALAAYRGGDDGALRELEVEVAQRWGTDPESVRELLRDYAAGLAD